MIQRSIDTLLLLLLFQIQVAAQGDWELKKSGDGIKVYTRTEASADYKSVKVEAVLKGTIDKLIQVLLDVDNNKNWVYNTKKSYLIKKINMHELIYYAETSLPVVSNRDIPIRLKINNDTANHILNVTTIGEPDAIPLNKGIVRVPAYSGTWHVKNNGNGYINIEYYFNVNPGGSLPSWVVNLFVTKGPFQTFKNLAELLQ